MSGYARRLLTHRTVEFYAVLAVVVVLPFLVLVVLGFVHLSQEGWVGLFVLLLFGLALVTFIAGWVFKRPESEPEELVEGLEPKKDWSIKDKGVWQRATQRIGSMQLVDRPWATHAQSCRILCCFGCCGRPSLSCSRRARVCPSLAGGLGWFICAAVVRTGVGDVYRRLGIQAP